jgi:hypothetical protein
MSGSPATSSLESSVNPAFGWVGANSTPAYTRRMDGEGKRGRARSFVLGGLLGASAAIATARRRRDISRRRKDRRLHPAGLAAFESSPCFQELLEEEEGARD